MRYDTVFGFSFPPFGPLLIEFARRNTSAQHELMGEPEAYKLLRDKNLMDMELYAYAASLHAAQVAEFVS